MPPKRLTVVLSEGRSKNPAKRGQEESICAALIMEPDIEVSLVPHLYDLTDDHTGTLYLRSVAGDMVLLSWLYPRAAHWVLDRLGVRGRAGTTLLESIEDEEDEELDAGDSEGAAAEEEQADDPGPAPGSEPADVPDRSIYCLNLRDAEGAEPFVEEIRRIGAESRVETVTLGMLTPPTSQSPAPQAAGNGEAAGAANEGTPDSAHVTQGAAEHKAPPAAADVVPPTGGGPLRFVESGTGRRWYPVIDYSRCTNCLECIDFCLFGVYGTTEAEQILVEQPDNCRKGCPACSRVCPENAIIFPEHKTPAIAGAPGGGAAALKIDLSKLFGAPDALELAALERDTELVAAGRDAVGMTVGIPKRQADKPAGPKDELDDLIDAVDDLGL